MVGANSSDTAIMDEPLRTYIYHAAMLVLSSIAAVINFVTVCAILLNRALRKEQNIFIFNLALADCASGVALFVRNIYDFPEISVRPQGFSWFIPLFTVGLLLSILSTLAIAFERLIVLRFDALRSRKIVTAKRSIAICVIGWVVVPSTYFFIHRFDETASFILGFVVSPCIILTCLVITAFCYILIYKKIATISDNVELNDAALQRRAKNSKKILATFALVVASTSACWVIMCSVLLVEYFGSEAVVEALWFRILSDVGNVLVCVNGILNPAIIWLRLTVFRSQISLCLSRLMRRGAFESQNTSDAQTDSTSIKQSISTINIDLKDID